MNPPRTKIDINYQSLTHHNKSDIIKIMISAFEMMWRENDEEK